MDNSKKKVKTNKAAVKSLKGRLQCSYLYVEKTKPC